MGGDILAQIVVLSPAIAAGILLIFAPLRRNPGISAGVTILATAISLGAAVMLALDFTGNPTLTAIDAQWPWLPSGGHILATTGVHIDAISAPMLVVVSLVALCVQVYSLGYLGHEPGHDRGRYFAYHALFAFSMLGLVIAPNLLQLFVCWELVGLASYLLIGYYWQKPSAGRAALKAFWVTKFADMGLMLGLMVLYTKTGNFDWNAPADVLLTADREWVAGLLLLAVIGKSAQFPLHIWLPDAMEGPTPVSALLHAATMVAAGVFLIVRAYPIFAGAPNVLTFMAWLGGFTALFAATVAVFQSDIKKVLAFSTCSQLGYMVAALGSGSMVAGYFHLTTHAFFKALLFLGAGSVIHAVHSNELADMGGLLRKMKPTAAMFIVGALALAGFPLFSGFFSKDLILEELLAAGHIVPLICCVLAAALTAFYMTRVVALTFFGEPSQASNHAHESPISMLGPMALLAVLSLVGGLLLGGFERLGGPEYQGFHVSALGIGVSVLGIAAIVFGFWRYSGDRRTRPLGGLAVPIANLVARAPVDGGFAFFYRRVLVTISAGAGWFDRYIIDGLVNLSGWAVLQSAATLRRVQSGDVGDYAYAVVGGLIFIAALGVWGS